MRHLGEKDRGEIRPTLVHRITRTGADKERVVTKMTRKLGREMGRCTVHMKMHNLDIGEARPSTREGLQEGDRRHRGLMHKHAVARLNNLERFIGGDDLHARDVARLGRDSSLPGERCVCVRFLFCEQLLLRGLHAKPRLFGGHGVVQVHLLEGLDDRLGHDAAHVLLVVGRHRVPGRKRA